MDEDSAMDDPSPLLATKVKFWNQFQRYIPEFQNPHVPKTLAGSKRSELGLFGY